MTNTSASPHSLASGSRRIAYLGPAGTFTEQALLSQPDLAQLDLVPMAKFTDILDAASTGSVDLGLVAIENAIEGTVNVTLDALAFDHDLLIQREVVLDIHLNLMAARGTNLADITTVASHPVASAQCRKYLNKELPDAMMRPSTATAEAAKQAVNEPGLAAIGPEQAAEHYGLDVLAPDIADQAGNQTRFVVVAPEGIPRPSGHDKTTVVLTQKEDKPGSLAAILQQFTARSINLSHLASRPVKTALGNYCFIVDFDGHISDELVADCLKGIRARYADVKFLGSYAAAGKGSTKSRQEANSAWDEAETWMTALRAHIPNSDT